MGELKKNLIDFSNKNVIITGASRGIGKACAKLFSELNANVILTYKSNEQKAIQTLKELSNSDNNHSIYQLDISSPDSIENFFNKLNKKYNKIDVLINNAGVYIGHKISEVSYEKWQQIWNETMSTNLTGVSNLCFFISRQMIKNGGGKIVNISSRGAFRGEPNYPAYGASKAGLNSLSQSLARALAKYNIIVGVIAPGYVMTDMASDILNSEKGIQIKKESPLGRTAEPEEIARMAAVFASDGFEYMTGAIIDINGASYLRN
jgi:3-oxoacyl-[acyl-carrier protein] reductase